MRSRAKTLSLLLLVVVVFFATSCTVAEVRFFNNQIRKPNGRRIPVELASDWVDTATAGPVFVKRPTNGSAGVETSSNVSTDGPRPGAIARKRARAQVARKAAARAAAQAKAEADLFRYLAAIAPPVDADPYGYEDYEKYVSDAGLARLRQCESTDRYTVTNPSGKFRGAYQFWIPTWNGVAQRHFPHLDGVDPIAAPPEAQDAMARALWSERGRYPWPECGRRV